MAEPFLGEIRIVSFGFAPRGWAQCNGQLLPINQNQALFSLLGTTFGGNGQTTFALPDFRGRIPVHWGSVISLGQRSGEETHTLTVQEMPAHTHPGNAATPGTGKGASSPASQVWGSDSKYSDYRSGKDTTMNAAAIATVGGSQPHENKQPYLVLNFVIALQGIFPSRN